MKQSYSHCPSRVKKSHACTDPAHRSRLICPCRIDDERRNRGHDFHRSEAGIRFWKDRREDSARLILAPVLVVPAFRDDSRGPPGSATTTAQSGMSVSNGPTRSVHGRLMDAGPSIASEDTAVGSRWLQQAPPRTLSRPFVLAYRSRHPLHADFSESFARSPALRSAHSSESLARTSTKPDIRRPMWSDPAKPFGLSRSATQLALHSSRGVRSSEHSHGVFARSPPLRGGGVVLDGALRRQPFQPTHLAGTAGRPLSFADMYDVHQLRADHGSAYRSATKEGFNVQRMAERMPGAPAL